MVILRTCRLKSCVSTVYHISYYCLVSQLTKEFL